MFTYRKKSHPLGVIKKKKKLAYKSKQNLELLHKKAVKSYRIYSKMFSLVLLLGKNENEKNSSEEWMSQLFVEAIIIISVASWIS